MDDPRVPLVAFTRRAVRRVAARARAAGERLGSFWLGRADPVRLDAFRVVFAANLLLYTLTWSQYGEEWLTSRGFHLSSGAAGVYGPVLPPLPSFVLPIFLAVYVGAIVTTLLGLWLPGSVWVTLLCLGYVTFADPLSAFTINRLFLAGFAALALSEGGAWFRLGRPEALTPSVWPIRVLQATLLLQYSSAGWCKAAHGPWLYDPTVLFTQVWGYYRTAFASFLIVTLPLWAWGIMQWSALVFEACAPILFGFRRLRPLAFAWGASFQILVAFTMDRLILFSLQLLCFYVLFAEDQFLHRIRAWFRRVSLFGAHDAKVAATIADVPPQAGNGAPGSPRSGP